jgi:SAM-dependent methyltransferase
MPAEFDSYAGSYDEDLERGLALTGEDKLYYATERVSAVRRALDRLAVRPSRVLDFGCGTGTSVPLLRGLLGAEFVLGLDPSAASLERARAEVRGPGVAFARPDERAPDGSFELAFSNGVFHHIPISQRAAAVDYVRQSLVPNGWFALWENNPINPGTRWVMRRVAFDRDAVPVSAGEARRLLRQGGFRVERTEFHFFFPRLLKWLRGLEPALRSVPLGGQYLVLGRRSR